MPESIAHHHRGYGTLYIVATPIGNLADITYRAVETLQSADLIAAEDKRNSIKLLRHYAIDTPMIALHEHNEAAMVASLQQRLMAGESIALISDAGTPLISDPGYRLVRQLSSAGIPITPIPGCSSITAAISAAGLPTDHFRYAGFLPRSGRARRDELARIISSDETIILLESPRRLQSTLNDLKSSLEPERELVVARELTKLHEEFVRGGIGDLSAYFDRKPPRGEIVLLIGPAGEQAAHYSDEQILDALGTPAMQALPPSARAKSVAKTLGIDKASVYALITGKR